MVEAGNDPTSPDSSNWFVSANRMDVRSKPTVMLQYALVALAVAVAVCVFELLLAAAFGAAGLLIGSLLLTAVIIAVLRRQRRAAWSADGRITAHELGLNPLPLWARTWHTPANLAGGTVVAIMLVLLAAALFIADWPLWAILALDLAVLTMSVITLLAFYYSASFLMSLLARLAGGELGVTAWLTTKGRYEEALGWSRRFINRRPNDPRGWSMSSFTQWNLGRLEEALIDADRAAKLQGSGHARMLRGILFDVMGPHQKACDDLEENENRKETLVYLGHSLIVLRRLDAAIVALREAGTLTDRADDFLQLGEAYRLRGDVDASLIAYAKAFALAFAGRTISKRPEAICAYCLVRIGRIDEAEQIAGGVLRDQQGDALALHTMALVHNLRGDADAKYDSIEQVLATSGIWAFRDRDFAPLLAQKRFRNLLAWALGAQRQGARARFGATQPTRLGGPQNVDFKPLQ